MMHHINFVVYVKVLCEPMNFQLSVNPKNFQPHSSAEVWSVSPSLVLEVVGSIPVEVEDFFLCLA